MICEHCGQNHEQSDEPVCAHRWEDDPVELLPQKTNDPVRAPARIAAFGIGVVVIITIAVIAGRASAPAAAPAVSEAVPAEPVSERSVVFDGTACEQAGNCRALESGFPDFNLDHETCPSSAVMIKNLQGHLMSRRAVEVELDLPVDGRCMAWRHGEPVCSLRCDLGIGQRQARAYSLGEVREREQQLLAWLRDTFGQEIGHSSHESRQGFGRIKTWSWRSGNTVLQLEHRDPIGGDDETRATSPGSHTQLMLRFHTTGQGR